MKADLQCFHSSLAPLFAARYHNHVTLSGRVGIDGLLHVFIGLAVHLNGFLCRRCSRRRSCCCCCSCSC